MRTEGDSVRRLVDDLSSAALRDLLRNVRHHTDVRRQVAAGLMDERSVNEAYREYARREGASYRERVTDLTLQYYSDLIDLGNQYSERFYGELLNGNGHAAGFGSDDVPFPSATNGATNAAGPSAPDPASNGHGGGEAAGVEEVPIELHGPSGREVMATFSLENTEQRPVEIAFDAGPCHGPGDESFIAPVTVSPARFTIDPGGTRSITIRVVMLPSVFVPGHLYRMSIHARGPTDIVLQLTIWAEEPDTGTPPLVDEPASRADATPESPAEPTSERTPERFVVRCPSCRRDFERESSSTRLYPHKTPDGEACPERRGRSRSAR
ncbi:MAG: hypothetical protein AAFP84_19095 [Actinomycetota bacterium]